MFVIHKMQNVTFIGLYKLMLGAIVYTHWVLYLVDLYTSLLMHIFRQSLMWEQLNPYKHADMVKRFSCFSDQMVELAINVI